MIGTLLTAVATSWLVAAEWNGARRHVLIAKPLASLGFLLVPLLQGRADTTMAEWLIVGLVLGAIGDVALMLEAPSAFIAGLGAFLLGHVAYIIGFSSGSFSTWPVASTTLVMAIVTIVSLRWLRPYLARPFDFAVPVYVLVISVMVVTAIGGTDVGFGAKVGAAFFAASDLTVARDRFILQTPWNRVVGLPLYYLAQLLIAWSIVGSAS